MDSAPMMAMAAEAAAAAAAAEVEGSDVSPHDGGWLPHGPTGDFASDINSIHAANATCAAFHADVAAKNAASLAQWVQLLWGQVAALQGKVLELEEWKIKTLDDMNRLRFEHALLRKKVSPYTEEDVPPLPGKAKSLPLLLAEHVDPGATAAAAAAAANEAGERKARKNKEKAASIASGGSASSSAPSSMRPPPGLETVESSLSSLDKSRTVRFAGAAVAAEQSPRSPVGLPSPEPSESSLGVPHSISMLSEISHLTDAPDEGLLEGVSVAAATVDGVGAEIASWRIGNLSTKLRGCMGRALVSSPFGMLGLQDLRLMVFPDGKEVAKGPRSRRQKELYVKKVTEGPLEGSVKLKVPDCPAPHTLRYYLKIGNCRRGPFEHNFAESTVNGCLDFGVDWLEQVEADLSMTVTVEVLKQGAAAGGCSSAGVGDPSTNARSACPYRAFDSLPLHRSPMADGCGAGVV